MYSTVRDLSGAIEAAAQLALPAPPCDDAFETALPLLIDQIAAEAGVIAPAICTRALGQARGDISRAVSLVRAWAATLPRLGRAVASLDDMHVLRRITPGFRAPAGGQFLGASLDYAQRLLDFDGPSDLSEGFGQARAQPAAGRLGVSGGDDAHPSVPEAAWPSQDRAGMPRSFQRAGEGLEQEGVLARVAAPVQPFDATRTNSANQTSRGAFLQLLSRAETGSLTALAYSAQRGFGQRQDPTLLELRQGSLPARMARPDTGAAFTLAWIPATTAEVGMYRIHDGQADVRLTLGFGATLGGVERRAIAAAILDATCARAAMQPALAKEPSEDQELLSVILDGQEASGFVEHLKLPHHVTFTSDLDRVRRVRGGAAE